MKDAQRLIRRHPLATLLALAGALAWLSRTVTARLFPVELPAPTGPHGVGRTAFDRVDASREDPYAGRPGTRRELPVTVWYPAERFGEAGAYLPGWWRAVGAVWGFDPARVRSHAVPEAPAAGTNRHPVLVFSPSGTPPHAYTALAEELASHGYVVAGVAHTHEPVPLTRFADGRVRPFKPASIGGALLPAKGPYSDDLRRRAALIDVKARDLISVVDGLEGFDAGTGPLAGRMNLGRIGAFGHSFGGAAAAEACRLDGRFGAGVALDAALWREPSEVEVNLPFMQIFAEHPEYTRPCEELVGEGAFPTPEYCREDRSYATGGWRRLHESADPGYCAQVRGAKHADFMDYSLLPLLPWSPIRRGLGTIGGRRMRRATGDLLLAFFDRHLKGEPSDGTAELPKNHPEVVFGEPDVLFAAGGEEDEVSRDGRRSTELRQA